VAPAKYGCIARRPEEIATFAQPMVGSNEPIRLHDHEWSAQRTFEAHRRDELIQRSARVLGNDPCRARRLAGRPRHRPTALAARLEEPSRLRPSRRSAALRSPDGSASRTAAITAQEGITDSQTPIVAG
jgi:hypothetical protein